MSEETSVAEEVEEEPQAAPETTGAQDDDLDSLLKEFEGVEETTEQKTEETDRLTKLEKELQEIREREQRQEIESELASLGAQIRGDLPADVFDDDLMMAYVEARAKKDPRLVKAFMNRAHTPSQWKKVVDGLSRDFQKRGASMPDRQVTEDVEAVANAVRSASTRASEEPTDIDLVDVRKMSDDDAARWRKEQAKKLGY